MIHDRTGCDRFGSRSHDEYIIGSPLSPFCAVATVKPFYSSNSLRAASLMDVVVTEATLIPDTGFRI